MYGEFIIRSYLKNNEISSNDKKLAFSLRSRMCNVKQNFKSTNLFDMTCPCCFAEPDTQLHLIFCEKLSGTVTEREYNCLFGNDDNKIGEVIKKMRKKINERKILLSKKYF